MALYRWLLLASCALAATAQTSDVEHGRAIYRSNCAFCHGLTGLGGRGPDLVGGQQRPDHEIKSIVKNGVPGSTMPAFDGFDDGELNRLIGFLRYLAGNSALTQKPTGNSTKGQRVYASNGCAGCHQIGNAGSTYGPELTRIGGARSVHYLEESIMQPSNDIPALYEGVEVVTKDGKKITGVRVNEDTFSIQLRLPSERYQSFLKSETKQITYLDKSLMPAYGALSKEAVNDLVAYLTTLKGPTTQGQDARKAEGIK